jgi:hypothetical protein
MDGNQRFWIALWSVVCVCIVAIAVSAFVYETVKLKAAWSAGYCETTVVGLGRPIWQKCEAK